MCIINTVPLGSHKTLNDYSRFLIERYIVPQYSRGCHEVHVLFDNPGRLEATPKHFEQTRRDKQAKVSAGHTCDIFTGQYRLPTNWRENVIYCRTCKRNLVYFLTKYFLPNISRYLTRERTHIAAGGFQGEIQDTAWFLTGKNKTQPNPIYTSNAEESDTRIWLHVQRSDTQTIRVMSPDTDIYDTNTKTSNCTDKSLQF